MTQFSRRSFLRSSAVMAGATIPWAGSLGLGSLLGEFASASQKPPHLEFPTAARDRLAVASWPFRAEIESPTNEYRNKKMKGTDLRGFAVQVKEKFGVPGVEPLSAHFPSTDEGYLHSFREAVAQAGVRVVNIPVDNAHSFYDADRVTRKQAVEHAKKWVDIAVILGSPSVRTSIAGTGNAKPNADVATEELRRVVDYAASKNILVNLENDDLISEDAFFVVKVIEKVNSPHLRALPDFCNSMASGNEKFNYDAVAAMFHHAYNICHVKDSEVGEQGKLFRVDLKKTFEILKASRYKGYCSMEW
jgi:sugar phosphate isomerase/epimerase